MQPLGSGQRLGDAARAPEGNPVIRPAISIECHDCGQVQDLPDLSSGGTAVCLRCHAVLWRRRGRDPLNEAMAFAITSVCIFAVALTTPMITVAVVGQQRVSVLLTGAQQLSESGLWPVGVVVAWTIALMPAVKLGATLLVLFGLRMEQRPPWLAPLFGWMLRIGRWAMIEVFLLGIFVAYSRLTAYATVGIGPALFALGGLMIVMAGTDVLMDGETVWQAMHQGAPAPPPDASRPVIGCERCHLASHAAEGDACPRCGAALHARGRGSSQTTWALVIAATIFYVPANLYPVMTVIRFGQGAPSTIVGGAIELLDYGMWPLALLVFFASITVPVLKLAGLVLMLLTSRYGYTGHLRDRTRLYRIVEAVGRWSMIDVFMISILVSLVQFGAIASVEPGSGAMAFAAVVILTMFAASAFDPKTMWDAAAARDAARGGAA